jgi:hypothetical protein
MIHVEHLSHEEKAALGEIKQRVQSLAGQRLRGILLFGSKARGDFDPESDLDVAILVDGLDQEMKRRIIDVVADVEVKFLLVVSSLVLSWSACRCGLKVILPRLSCCESLAAFKGI